MSIPSPVTFDRVLNNRELAKGRARVALVWGIAAAFLLGVILLHVGLLLSLFADRGVLEADVTPAEQAWLAAIEPSFHAPDKRAADQTVFVANLDSGILPSVWRLRQSWLGGLLTWMYKTFPWLQSKHTALVGLLVAGAILLLIRYACLEQVRSQSDQAGQQLTNRLRSSLHRQGLRLCSEDLSSRTSDEATRLLLVDLPTLELSVSEWISRFAMAVPEIVVLLGVAAIVDLRTTVQWVIPLALCGFIIDVSRQRIEQAIRDENQNKQTVWSRLSRQFSQARLIRTYGLEQSSQEKFEAEIEKTTLPSAAGSKLAAESRRWLWLAVAAGTSAGLLLFMLLSVKTLDTPPTMSFPSLVLFLVAFALLLRPVFELGRIRLLRDEIGIASHQLSSFLSRLPVVGQAVGAKFLQPLSRTIHFEQVRYAPAGSQPLLDGIDLRLAAGKVYAIAAFEPLEARAFASLLIRLVEPQTGRILLDGEDIAWGTLESLRAESVYVDGSEAPMDGTVLENIRAAQPTATTPEAMEAAKLARAHNFILTLPQGYETLLGEGGAQLDAGQIFRLNLARATIRNPSLLLIEEPSVPLDDDAKALLDDAYQRILPGRTVFIIPNRMTSLRRADTILLLKHGKVAEMASHESLVKDSALYRHWEYLRFHEFRRDPN